MYQVRTLPGGRTYGLYNVQLEKWVAPDGKTTAGTSAGAWVFQTPLGAKAYRDKRGFEYSKNYENRLIAEANLIFDPRDTEDVPEYLRILRKREAAMDEMFSPEYQKSLNTLQY